LIASLWAIAYWSSRLGRFGTSTVIVLIVVAVFALARGAGNATALSDFADQRVSDYSAYPRVRVAWGGANAPADEVAADILKSDCGRLLAVSKERLFLIRPARGASALDLDTFILSSKKAEALRIRADYGSCS